MLTDVICGVWVCYKEAGRIYSAALLTSSAGSCRFLTDQKAAEKVAASSEARGTAQGDRGPLENPLGLDGVDRELQRLRRRKACAGSFSVSRFAKAHPVSRLDSDPLPQVGIGLPEGWLLSHSLYLSKASPARGGGCAGKRRRRGAAPCLANILPGRRKPLGGRERPPYIAAGNGQQRTNASLPPYPPAGSSRIVSQTLRCRKPCGPMKSSAPTQVRGACRLRSRLSCQPFSFRNCSINATSLSTPSGGMAL